MMALVITNVALVITNVALVMYIVYIIVKFQKSNYQSCIGNNQCLNDNNQFRICRYQLLTNWLLPMQDWLLPNVFLACRNNQFSMPYYQCMVLQCDKIKLSVPLAQIYLNVCKISKTTIPPKLY